MKLVQSTTINQKLNLKLIKKIEFLSYNNSELDKILSSDLLAFKPINKATSSYDVAISTKSKAFTAHYIKPDLILENSKDGIPTVKLYNILDEYEISNYSKNTKFIVDALKIRNENLIKVANFIVKRQLSFFIYNSPLNSITHKEISQTLNLHISTVSRILKNKYLKTNIGIFELKDLLSKNIKGHSLDKILTNIAIIIRDEDKKNTLSDEEIRIKLNEINISISRRSITKYRNYLGIENFRQRKIPD